MKLKISALKSTKDFELGQTKLIESHYRRSIIFSVSVVLILILLCVLPLLSLSVTLRCFCFDCPAPKVNGSTPFVQTTSEPPNPSCLNVPDSEKFDCYPDAPVTEEECVRRGCCYHVIDTAAFDGSSSISYPPLGIPYCYYPSDYLGYSIKNIEKVEQGFTAELERAIPSGFPKDDEFLSLLFFTVDENTVQISFGIRNSSIQNVSPHKPIVSKNVRAEDLKYEMVLSPNGTLSVKRKTSGVSVFHTDLRRLVHSYQFKQISNRLPSKFIYGLGEEYGGLLKNVQWTRTVMFNRDNAPVPGKNLYGSQPFYIGLEEDHNAHGVLFINTAAMDVILQPTPAITYRAIGGLFSILVFLGPTPDEVVQQYSNIIALPSMPPYWSLGFHLCRYGYNSLNATKVVWKRTRDANIPFDTQWNDIDYMDRRNDFTYDKTNFSGLPEFVQELHSEGMHYVVILDPGVSNAEKPGTYPPYDDGVKEDVFVKNSDGTIFVGKVWNKVSTVFPDFLNEKTLPYWQNQLRNLHEAISYDGLWIDMNEPSNFYDGQKDGCPESPLENPPYVPGGLEPLRSRTMCMTALHSNSIPHYFVHNLYGYSEAGLTYLALENITNKRPFIISRSTFTGQGSVSGHWSGDISSSWQDMQYSVVDLLNFNIFGIPMMGSDICGFRDDTTVELCARWSALGAFYPFSRNHNDLGKREQDPVALGEEVVKAARNTLTTRYQLLPYLYYLFYRSSVYGNTVARPLFFEFTDDPVTYDIDEQFLWGPALMIMPALTQGATSIKVYFPKTLWYDYYTGQEISSSGDFAVLPAPMDSINLALRGGYIIPHQHNNLTTAQSRKNKFYIVAGLNEHSSAYGELYWDDGESLHTVVLKSFNLIQFSIKNSILSSNVRNYGYDVDMDLDYVKICGLDVAPTEVVLNGKLVSHQFDKYKCLTATVDVSLKKDFILTWK